MWVSRRRTTSETMWRRVTPSDLPSGGEFERANGIRREVGQPVTRRAIERLRPHVGNAAFDDDVSHGLAVRSEGDGRGKVCAGFEIFPLNARNKMQMPLAAALLQIVSRRKGYNSAPSPAARVRHPEVQTQRQTKSD